ncbi:MAG TPA: hypothetical protein VIM65_21845 [Cyclobacteriaceae bacterium]
MPLIKAKNIKVKPTQSYNTFKDFNGQRYTGMKVGRSHKWNYDKGVWRETKVTPERWELTYDVIKRRAGHAPEGSGAAVGTAYHWFILSHQYVEKLNADDYTTSMVGLKFKLAHKRAGQDKWSVSDASQRKALIKILKNLITELEDQPQKTVPVPLNFLYRGKDYKGTGIPVISSCHDGICDQLDITLNKKHLGVLKCTNRGWRINAIPQGLANAIGEQVFKWYE